eukprot:TRINITY_DN8957_c0_g1_i1.p1 TRINITY_DN8957_c0_g1~~TRINITY_DN8957_c0_g1_i1.p1  ORF type:complete len:295 (-),score=138.55 TRINITY_DN8957_c0_g1_i1:20-904(-)
MIKLTIVIFTLFFIISIYHCFNIVQASYQDCDDIKLKTGVSCAIKATQLRPTQFVVGMDEVECKKQKYNGMSKSDLQNFLQKSDNIVPAVLGPNGELYITDHHHQTRAVIESNKVNDVNEIVYIEADLSQSSNFWQSMVSNNWAWLYDEKVHQPINPSLLPIDFLQLVNDPYRSLAWYVRHQGGYGKTSKSYQDFIWANFFRDNLNLTEQAIINNIRIIDNDNNNNYNDFNNSIQSGPSTWTYCQTAPYSLTCFPNEPEAVQAAVPAALKLALSPAAAGLPGYGEGEVDPISCE